MDVNDNNITTIVMPVNPIYMAFGSPGFKWTLFLLALAYALIAAIGVPLNFSVCWITYKYRTSNRAIGSNTGILIGLNSFFELLHQSTGHFTFFAIAASGTNFFPLRTFFYLNMHSTIGMFSSFVMIPLLSLDRLFAVVAPISYHNLNQRLYILLHLLAISVFDIYLCQEKLRIMLQYPDWQMTGWLGDDVPIVGPSRQIIFLTAVCVAIVSYLLIGFCIKCNTEAANEKMQKLYRSLALIVVANLCGYLQNFLLTSLMMTSVIVVTPLQFWFIKMFTSLFLNIAGAANGPILFVNSTEYRAAYAKEFIKAKKAMRRGGNRVTTIETH